MPDRKVLAQLVESCARVDRLPPERRTASALHDSLALPVRIPASDFLRQLVFDFIDPRPGERLLHGGRIGSRTPSIPAGPRPLLAHRSIQSTMTHASDVRRRKRTMRRLEKSPEFPIAL